METNVPVIAGAISTTTFALSTPPMLFKAFRTSSLTSNSLGNILPANMGTLSTRSPCLGCLPGRSGCSTLSTPSPQV